MARMLQKIMETYKVDSEEEAIKMIETAKDNQIKEGYSLTKSSYVMKTKKSKGEIVELWYVCSIEKTFNE